MFGDDMFIRVIWYDVMMIRMNLNLNFTVHCFFNIWDRKKLKQPKRKQNAENKKETKMRPNMIKWEEKAIFQHTQKGGLSV